VQRGRQVDESLQLGQQDEDEEALLGEVEQHCLATVPRAVVDTDATETA
jgi:hypothetical protein